MKLLESARKAAVYPLKRKLHNIFIFLDTRRNSQIPKIIGSEEFRDRKVSLPSFVFERLLAFREGCRCIGIGMDFPGTEVLVD